MGLSPLDKFSRLFFVSLRGRLGIYRATADPGTLEPWQQFTKIALKETTPPMNHLVETYQPSPHWTRRGNAANETCRKNECSHCKQHQRICQAHLRARVQCGLGLRFPKGLLCSEQWQIWDIYRKTCWDPRLASLLRYMQDSGLCCLMRVEPPALNHSPFLREGRKLHDDLLWIFPPQATDLGNCPCFQMEANKLLFSSLWLMQAEALFNVLQVQRSPGIQTIHIRMKQDPPAAICTCMARDPDAETMTSQWQYPKIGEFKKLKFSWTSRK